MGSRDSIRNFSFWQVDGVGWEFEVLRSGLRECDGEGWLGAGGGVEVVGRLCECA